MWYKILLGIYGKLNGSVYDKINGSGSIGSVYKRPTQTKSGTQCNWKHLAEPRFHEMTCGTCFLCFINSIKLCGHDFGCIL